jgi:hypothetical protein
LREVKHAQTIVTCVNECICLVGHEHIARHADSCTIVRLEPVGVLIGLGGTIQLLLTEWRTKWLS